MLILPFILENLLLLAHSTRDHLNRFALNSCLVLLFCFFASQSLHAQEKVTVRGTVYDSSRNFVLELVSVMSNRGIGTFTDARGKFEMELLPGDSIWFSYLNKPTQRYPVAKMQNPLNFEISLHINITTLKEVKVRPKDYKQDSLQNREDYAKVFNYKKPGIGIVRPQTQHGAAMGFDLNQLIGVFQFRKNRSMAKFQERLITQEQDKFVDRRFNKGLVRRLTGLTEPAIDSFMMLYRPNFFITSALSEYDFQYYIKASYERFKNGLGPVPFRPEEFLEVKDQ